MNIFNTFQSKIGFNDRVSKLSMDASMTVVIENSRKYVS
jgi:hypothetical protein